MSMTAAWIQRWRLVGLAPMHDAMIRRLAFDECLAVRNDSKADLSIAWSCDPALEAWSQWARGEHADVLIVDAERLIDAMGGIATAPQRVLTGTERHACLRLVWSSLDGLAADATWCTEWLASGAITDPGSLEAWIRTAVRTAARHPKPADPSFRDLTKLPVED